jgi:16S rRNA (uracil1498-N3)-methyltransferase
MERFILSSMPEPGGLIRLSGKDYHYLVRVRRLRPGAAFNARLPGGDPVRVLVRSIAGDLLLGECRPPDPAAPADGPPAASPETASTGGLPRILLFQALPKGAKMDLIVRQAAEGGLAGVYPFVSAYSVPKIAGKAEDSGRLERWRRIVKEARQQSGSAVDTVVHAPCTLEELLAHWRALEKQAFEKQAFEKRPIQEGTLPEMGRALGLFLHQDPLARGTFHGYLDKAPCLVAAAVGPEGGFSPEEVSRFMAEGFKPLTMGDTILRTETAAVYAAAAIRIILLESASWTPKIP